MDPAKNFKLLLLIGQSNALGQGTDPANLSGSYASYSDEYTLVSIAQQLQCNIDDGVTACAYEQPSSAVKPRINSQGEFGPEIGIARSIPNIVSHAAHGYVHIVKCATGASDLANDWDPDAVTGRVLYSRMKNFIEDPAQAWANSYEVVGAVWIQGEADAAVLAEANAYEANLTAFIARIRSDFNNATMPFAVARLNDEANMTYKTTVQAAEDAVAAADANVVTITPTPGLSGDSVHYDDNGYADLGKIDLGPAIDGFFTACTSQDTFSSALNFAVPLTNGVGGNSDFTSQYATNEWTLQSTDTTQADSVSGAIVEVTGGMLGQTAVGIFNGTNHTSRNAWEVYDSSAGRIRAVDAATMDVTNSNNLCFKVAVRFNAAQASDFANVFSKRTSDLLGWGMFINTSGHLRGFITTPTSTIINTLEENHADGAWHEVCLFYDVELQEITTKSDLGEIVTDVSSISGSISTTGVMQIGNTGNGAQVRFAQYTYAGGAIGVNARSMYEQDLVLPGQDPTGLLTTIERSGTMGIEVEPGNVSFFKEHSLPIGYHDALTGSTGYGLSCNKGTSNHMSYSEDLSTGWANNGGGSTVSNLLVAPHGFKTAHAISKTSGLQYGGTWDKVSLQANTQYTLSCWANRIIGSGPALEIRNEADSVVIAENQHLGLTSGSWERISLTFTTTATTDHVVRIRASYGELAEDATVGMWGLQVAEGSGSHSYVRTLGTPTTVAENNYRVADALPVNKAKLTIPCVSVGTSDSSYIFDTDVAIDRRSLHRDEGTVWMSKYGNASGTQWANISGSGPLLGQYSDIVSRWDILNGLSEDSSKFIATHINSRPSFWNSDKTWAAPYSEVRTPTTAIAQTRDLLIGCSQTAGAAFEGLIQSITIAGEAGEPPTLSGLQPGVDFWLTNESVDFSTDDIPNTGFPGANGWYAVSYTGGITVTGSFANRVDPNYELTISGSTGAELNTTGSAYLYGRYRSTVKSSPVSGTVSAVFFYRDGDNEIDVEILGKENGEHLVHFVVHNDQPTNDHYTVNVGFDPSNDFHEYGFDWNNTGIEFFVDGHQVAQSVNNIPSGSGTYILNAWSNSNSWAAGPAPTESEMQIKEVSILHDP